MYLTPHAVVGMLLARAVGSPGAAFAAAAGSHYLIDLVPHGDEIVAVWVKKSPRKGMAVGLVDLGLLILVTAITCTVFPKPDRWLLLAGAAGSVLPDFVSNIIPFAHRNVFQFRFVERLRLWIRRSFVQRLLHAHNRLHYGLHNLFKVRLTFVQGLILQTITTIAVLFGLVS